MSQYTPNRSYLTRIIDFVKEMPQSSQKVFHGYPEKWDFTHLLLVLSVRSLRGLAENPKRGKTTLQLANRAYAPANIEFYRLEQYIIVGLCVVFPFGEDARTGKIRC